MGMKFDTSFIDLAKEYDAEIDDIVEAVDEAVEKEAYRAQALAKKLTPVETGRLRDSAGVRRIGFADYSIVYPVWYAIYVHERKELFHDGQKRAKFLEGALRILAVDFPDNVGEHVKKRVTG